MISIFSPSFRLGVRMLVIFQIYILKKKPPRGCTWLSPYTCKIMFNWMLLYCNMNPSTLSRNNAWNITRFHTSRFNMSGSLLRLIIHVSSTVNLRISISLSCYMIWWKMELHVSPDHGTCVLLDNVGWVHYIQLTNYNNGNNAHNHNLNSFDYPPNWTE